MYKYNNHNEYVYAETEQFTVLYAQDSYFTIIHNKTNAKRLLSGELATVFEIELEIANKYKNQNTKNTYINAICSDWCLPDSDEMQFEDSTLILAYK